MFKWIVLLTLIGCLYWIYQRGDLRPLASRPASVGAPQPVPTREGAGRLGGGLNPFVTDTDIDAPPQRPHAP
jgi:hypothetical protein